jgi:hypothetical protein
MSRFRQRQTEAARRSAERRQREDEAPRLLSKVPTLESLTLEVQEHRAGAPLGESKYTRRIVVSHAPAIIELPCLESTCEGGGYDVTATVLAELRAGATRFEGHDICRGHTKTSDCRREVHYVGVATYRSVETTPPRD